ncbi:MAG: hypothetical protein WEB19_03385 [Acidimicrobiia bacterium]
MLTIVGVVAALLLVAVAFVRFQGGDDPVMEPPLTASPVPESPTPTATGTASPEATDATASPAETASPGEPREPTDSDAAAFASSYTPPGSQSVDFVAVDLTGDERKEIVFASLSGDRSRVDIAAWDGEEYEIVFIGEGGSADELDRFFVRDFTGDGYREVVTVQSSGAQGQSLAVWGYDGTKFAPQRARGGCWDGSHVYGIVGATISEGRIEASCDGSPLPTAAWPSDVYAWDGQAWSYEATRTSS